MSVHKVERHGGENQFNPNKTDSFAVTTDDFGDESIVGRALFDPRHNNDANSTYRPALFTQGSPLEQTPRHRQLMQQRVNVRTQGRDKAGGSINPRQSEPSYLNNTQADSTIFSSMNNGG